jgi:hypothetical protein
MTPHEVRHPERPPTPARESWGTLPMILAAAAVILVCVWIYKAADNVSPLTSNNGPSNSQAPNR